VSQEGAPCLLMPGTREANPVDTPNKNK
jgi:hypothetical protein